MKTLKDHVILYDSDCPMCNLYTKAFVKTGMLDETGRDTYQCNLKGYPTVDPVRAVNEIALVHKATGKVEYGVKSIILILQNSFPMLKSILNSTSVFWIADKLYKFISYNRRLIVPSSSTRNSSFLSDPSFHVGYRIAYLVIAWLVTSLLLHLYSFRFDPLLAPTSFYREFLICAGQVFWQLGVIQVVNKRKGWDYVGNMMTISLAGALLLGFINSLGAIIGIEEAFFYIPAFALVVFLMFLEHIRRTRLLYLSWIMTASWVAYRLAVLLIIF